MDEENFFKMFGRQVKQFRKQKGWSQLEMALELQIHPNELSNIECGRRNPTLSSVYRIANTLKIKVNQLFEFE